MLIYVSFSTYFTCSLLTVVVYYGLIWLLYFAKKPKSLQAAMVSVTNQRGQEINRSTVTATEADVTQKQTSANLSDLVHDMVDELKALLLQLAVEKAEPDQIMGSIRRLLKKYPALKTSALHTAIENLVGVETEEKCGLRFSPAELACLWND